MDLLGDGPFTLTINQTYPLILKEALTVILLLCVQFSTVSIGARENFDFICEGNKRVKADEKYTYQRNCSMMRGSAVTDTCSDNEDRTKEHKLEHNPTVMRGVGMSFNLSSRWGNEHNMDKFLT